MGRFLTALLLAAGSAGCGSPQSGGGQPASGASPAGGQKAQALILAAYTTPREAYGKARSTILIQNLLAVVDAFFDKHGLHEAAQAFVDLLWTPEARRAHTQFVLRPVDPEVARKLKRGSRRSKTSGRSTASEAGARS